MRARVGIVDDHPAIILGTTAILNAQPDMHVVAIGATVAELLTLRLRLDVVLLDLVLADGSSPAENVNGLAPVATHIIAFTSGDRPRLVREAAAAGVMGMIRKTEDPMTLVASVRAILGGNVVASADWAAALEADVEFVDAKLSNREAEVLALYASGETADRVAAQLYISRETVLDHIRRIRAKYAAADRPARTKIDLYRRAMEDGIVTPDPSRHTR